MTERCNEWLIAGKKLAADPSEKNFVLNATKFRLGLRSEEEEYGPTLYFSTEENPAYER